MRQYTNPKDDLLAAIPGAQVRRIGKKRRTPAWKLAAVAKAAPHELDDQPEDSIRAQVHADIEAAGLPYLTVQDAELFWLKREAAKGNHHAMNLLAALKDLPDFTVWKPAPGMPYALSLPLELKVRGKGGRPGQRAFRAAAGGVITQGYTEASEAFQNFLNAKAPTGQEGLK